jgi:Tfp pilus assembly protein PilF/peroxiredoxin
MKDIKVLICQVIFFIGITLLSISYTATAQALLQIGSEAPNFTLKDIEGRELSLSQFSPKKAVILIFWSTWSAKSQIALKRFEDFYKKYKDRDIEIIAINADKQSISEEDIKNIITFIKEAGVTFPVLIDKGLDTFSKYGVIALPSTVVIVDKKINYELPGLPLIGTEDMFDYLTTLVGEVPRRKVESKYKPKHSAIADTNLAKRFINKKNYSMAYPLLKKAIESDPKYMLPYVELSRLYRLENNYSEAEEILKKALSIEPENTAILCELGYQLTVSKKIKEAIEVLDKARTDESYAPAFYYRGYALAKEGKFEESLKEFEKAIFLNPYDITLFKLRAEVFEEKDMLKEASEDYKRALELMLKIKL